MDPQEPQDYQEDYSGPWRSAITCCPKCGWKGASVWPAIIDLSELECDCGHIGLIFIEDCAAQGEG